MRWFTEGVFTFACVYFCFKLHDFYDVLKRIASALEDSRHSDGV